MKLREVQQDYIEMHIDFLLASEIVKINILVGPYVVLRVSSISLEWRIHLLKIPASPHSALKFLQRAYVLFIILLSSDSLESSYVIRRSNFWNMKIIKREQGKLFPYFLKCLPN